MTERKDFVSEGLVTLRHKYIAEELNARKGAEDVSAAYDTPGADKSLSIQEQHFQTYCRIRDDLNLRLNKELAVLKTQVEVQKQDLKKYEAAGDRIEKLLAQFSDMPQPAEFDGDSNILTRMEKLRVDFFSTKASYQLKSESQAAAPAAGSPQFSLLPELNSLHQMQMFKMGLFFALPTIIGVIAGCAIIAWAIIITWGG